MAPAHFLVGGRPGWAPVPNKPTVSVDVKQHFSSSLTSLAGILIVSRQHLSGDDSAINNSH